jgi:hypothetical protein
MTLIPSSHRTGANYSDTTVTIFCYESLSAKEMGKELRQRIAYIVSDDLPMTES